MEKIEPKGTERRNVCKANFFKFVSTFSALPLYQDSDDRIKTENLVMQNFCTSKRLIIRTQMEEMPLKILDKFFLHHRANSKVIGFF